MRQQTNLNFLLNLSRLFWEKRQLEASRGYPNLHEQALESVPMLSPPCESVQICKDPDRYSRIHQKLNSRKNSFEIEISCLKVLQKVNTSPN